ncbi:hypothetical protein QSH14_09740 [Proteus faecis]|uniref:Uncharacterized protein n=1 Tax=Proteus faecis TaxID=2050967 RepID=A0AAW7CQQ9_9GAMM|nr:hypothetical protein [Proteus faecis]MDO5404007.1 hypothetical protein [Proteus sp. (in: enterobacteria)]MDL5167416.1 hypothetical protein [Proteus faecis]MDL5275399.1 hypothetical protein [Proteus faecis]MDL5278968.1 hypothetical protein [Proteus faecis]MDL5307912.1 hypothetical protein [Proteus faecis]
MLKNIAISLSLLFITSSAFSATLAEKELQQKFEENIQSRVMDLNKSCDTNIKVVFDWPAFSADDLKTIGIDSYCSEGLKGVINTCESSQIAQETVKEKIENIICSKATPRSIELKDGTLNFGIDFNAANDAKAVQEHLMNNL